MTAADLRDSVVTYWEGDTLVVQTGHGELIVASDTVLEAER